MAAYNAFGFFGSFSADATHAATWTQGVIKYEQWKLERKLPMLVLCPKKSDVAAYNAWSKKGSFSADATHAATWTQGVIKYEQWKLERKLPMLVLFRARFIRPRVRHFQDVIGSKAKNTEKIASSYYARHYRAEADKKRIGS